MADAPFPDFSNSEWRPGVPACAAPGRDRDGPVGLGTASPTSIPVTDIPLLMTIGFEGVVETAPGGNSSRTV